MWRLWSNVSENSVVCAKSVTMGCCCGKNEVTPGDTPIKKRPSSTGYGHFKANVVDALYVMIHLCSFC